VPAGSPRRGRVGRNRRASCSGSGAARGHTNRPRSSSLANRHSPSPSHHNSLTRSPRRPRTGIPWRAPQPARLSGLRVTGLPRPTQMTGALGGKKQAETGKLLRSHEPDPKLDRAYDKQHSLICRGCRERRRHRGRPRDRRGAAPGR
jgi:hypothetical protein